MEIQIKSRNGRLREDEHAYLERKLQKLDRYLENIGTVHVDLARAQQRGSGEVHTVQATLAADHGVILRAEERSSDFTTAVDALHDSLQRQITRYKDRHYRRGKIRRSNGEMLLAGEEEAAPAMNGSRARLVKTKQFSYKPMDSDEAIEQMELLDHDFFVFTDAQTNLVNVVYRRNDGNYGLIEQEPE
jgi:putative sigma-54 modulation protein